MEEPESPLTKPQWLLRLEEESWQAELIISGVAIFGALQLPAGIEVLIDWTLVNIDPRFHILLYFFFIYLQMGAYALIVTFIGHFVLRTFWVGLLGLNSVFPKGINKDSNTYSPVLVEGLRRDFPDTNALIQQVDRLCSLIFAFGTLLTMILLAINLDILVLAGLYRLALEILGERLAGIAGSALLLFALILFLLVTIMNVESLRRLPLVKKWHYPIYRTVNRGFLHLFYQPIVQLSMIFQTNIKLRNYIGTVVLFILILLTLFAIQLPRNRMVFFARADLLSNIYDRGDRLLSEHYRSLRPDNRRLLSILMDSDVVEGPYLRVFVPVFGNESTNLDSLCGVWTDRPNLDEDANLDARRQFVLDCYARAHRFFIDGRLLPVVDPIRHEHPNQGEAGFLVYLPTAGLTPGRHTLVVEKVGGRPGNTARRMQAVFLVL